MNTVLLNRMARTIAAGLKRKSITSCSRWSETYRIMGKPFPGKWTFNHHPWSREIHDCPAEMIIGQKAAQMAFTETALNKTFFNIDILGNSVLYILPASTPDAHDFSTSRFDPALEMSPHLRDLFSDVKNIGHKRAGSANLFIRGSRSRSQMKSLPVGLIIADEVDEMNLANLVLAFERLSGQIEKQSFLLSTPTIDKIGINEYFLMSTQREWFFKCPHCSKTTRLVFPDCLVITADSLDESTVTNSHLVCKECKGVLKHDEKTEWLANGEWVPEYSNREIEGYHISQLYSMTVRPNELAVAYLKGQMNEADEQEFYNSKLGLTHTIEGAKINDSNILGCIGNCIKLEQSLPNTFVTMGIDVGKMIHYEVDQWNLDFDTPSIDINLVSKARLLTEGKVNEFEELDGLMKQYRVFCCVIDAQPERRKSLEFAQRFPGRVKVCYYPNGLNTRQIAEHSNSESTISVDRTSWMDVALGRIRSRRILLPKDISTEWQNHIKAPVRIYKKDREGNPIGMYVTGNEADHHAHTRVYNEVALKIGASLLSNRNINDVY